MGRRNKKESSEKRKERLAKARQKYYEKKMREAPFKQQRSEEEKKAARREKMKIRKRKERATETQEQRERRLRMGAERVAKARSQESQAHREARLARMRERVAMARFMESREQRDARLARMRDRNAKARYQKSQEERLVTLREHATEARIEHNNTAESETQKVGIIPKNTMAPRKCNVLGCNSTSENSILHTFPKTVKNGTTDVKEIERCKVWLKNIDNPVLHLVPIKDLHSRFLVCSRHFRKDQYCNSKCKLLKRTAVPTLYMEKEHLQYEVARMHPGHILQCCVWGCGNTNVTHTMHTFPCVKKKISNGIFVTEPDNAERCKKWVLNIKNSSLFKIPLEDLYEKYYLCSDHFEKDQYCDVNSTLLSSSAIPTRLLNVLKGDAVDDNIVQKNDLSQGGVGPNDTEKADKESEAGADNWNSRRVKRKCAVPRCQTTNLSSIKLHAFPSDIERCKKWVANVGNAQLLGIPVEDLFERYYVCSNHFETDQYCNRGSKKLKNSAIPTRLMNGNKKNAESANSQQSEADKGAAATTNGGNETWRLQRQCCAPGCVNTNYTSRLYAFPPITRKTPNNPAEIDPNGVKRCEAWVRNTGNTKLTMVNPLQLQKDFFLCSLHFEDSEYSSFGTLHRYAVPRIFSTPPLPNFKFQLGIPAAPVPFIHFVDVEGIVRGKGVSPRDSTDPNTEVQTPAPEEERIKVEELHSEVIIKEEQELNAISVAEDESGATLAEENEDYRRRSVVKEESMDIPTEDLQEANAVYLTENAVFVGEDERVATVAKGNEDCRRSAVVKKENTDTRAEELRESNAIIVTENAVFLAEDESVATLTEGSEEYRSSTLMNGESFQVPVEELDPLSIVNMEEVRPNIPINKMVSSGSVTHLQKQDLTGVGTLKLPVQLIID